MRPPYIQSKKTRVGKSANYDQALLARPTTTIKKTTTESRKEVFSFSSNESTTCSVLFALLGGRNKPSIIFVILSTKSKNFAFMLTNIQLNMSTDVSETSESSPSLDTELKETFLSAAFANEWQVSSTDIIIRETDTKIIVSQALVTYIKFYSLSAHFNTPILFGEFLSYISGCVLLNIHYSIYF